MTWHRYRSFAASIVCLRCDVALNCGLGPLQPVGGHPNFEISDSDDYRSSRHILFQRDFHRRGVACYLLRESWVVVGRGHCQDVVVVVVVVA